MSGTSSLVGYVRDLCRHLALGTRLDVDEITDSLDALGERVTELYHDYDENPAPVGAEAIREYIMEALQLIHDAIEDIYQVIEEEESGLLAEAVSKVEEADDIFASITYAIEQNQQNLSSASIG